MIIVTRPEVQAEGQGVSQTTRKSGGNDPLLGSWFFLHVPTTRWEDGGVQVGCEGWHNTGTLTVG